jgi:hypothetical protein
MSSGLISFFFGAGVAGYAYYQLSKRNGSATPSSNIIAACVAGVIAGIVLLTVLVYMLHF